MKSVFLAIAAFFVVQASFQTSCEAAPIWNCGGGKPEATSPCADPEIARLDKAIDARLGRLIPTADPVTGMLLKRDRRWFVETLTEGKPSEIELQSDDDRKNLRTKLAERLKTLEAMQPRADAIPGEWANALLKVKVTKAAGDALLVEMTGEVQYVDLGDPVECTLKAEVKPGADGWFTGTATPGEDKPADDKKAEKTKDKPAVLRLRMQAGTLRIVLLENERSDFCTASSFITGSYFPTGAAPSSGKAQAIAPSFDCATVKNEDEEEICSDPELAQKDVELAKLYGNTLKRLDSKNAGYLRDDQRGWSKLKNDSFQFYIHPYWDKRHYRVHHTDNARDELLQNQAGRIEMLRGLDEARKGFAGRWISHNASLNIEPKKDTKDGTLTVIGGKWDVNDYKSGCEFDAEGKPAGNAFKTDGGAPRLARDGMTLTVDAHYPDKPRTKTMDLKMERPDYCNRLDSAKARLFPIKDDAKVKEGR